MTLGPGGERRQCGCMPEEFASGTALESGAIVVSGLVKDFGTVRALDHLDLTAFTGEVHAAATPPAIVPFTR